MSNGSETTPRGSSIYTLSKLPPGDWTRVLVLASGEFTDPIVCSLQLHNLNDDSAGSEPFEALSYVWDSASQKYETQVNGQVMEITSNLFTALQQLRSRQISRRIWADAICINQLYLTEKGQQVNNMGRIYAAASRVVVWLGPDEKRIAGPAIKAIQKFNGLVEEQLTPQKSFPGWGALADPFETLSKKEIQYAIAVFQRPWFTRVWVIQEVGVAAKVLLAWGSVKVDFAEVIQFVCSWSHFALAKRFPRLTLLPLARLFSYIWASYIHTNVEAFDKSWFNESKLLQHEARRMRTTRTMQFEDIMYSCMHILKATDSRDLVYAFLGHPTATHDDGTPLLDADYTIDEVALRIRIFSRLSQRSLRFMGLVWHVQQDELTNMPTWCPKFGSFNYHQISNRYNASKALSSTMLRISPTVAANSLTISALLVDEIHLCGEVAGTTGDSHILTPYTAFGGILHEVMERYWAVTEEAYSQLRSAYTYTDRTMAFASTLIAAIGKDDERVLARCFDLYCREYCPSIHAHLQGELSSPYKIHSISLPILPSLEEAISRVTLFPHRLDKSRET